MAKAAEVGVTQFGRILQKVDFLENSLSLEMPVF